MSESVLLGLASVLALGVGAQWLAWRLKVPSILLLLLVGFVAGPVTNHLDPDALLLASLAKRLRGRERIADEREFQRLFRYLSAQGFETEKILAHLRKYQSR